MAIWQLCPIVTIPSSTSKDYPTARPCMRTLSCLTLHSHRPKSNYYTHLYEAMCFHLQSFVTALIVQPNLFNNQANQQQISGHVNKKWLLCIVSEKAWILELPLPGPNYIRFSRLEALPFERGKIVTTADFKIQNQVIKSTSAKVILIWSHQN